MRPKGSARRKKSKLDGSLLSSLRLHTYTRLIGMSLTEVRDFRILESNAYKSITTLSSIYLKSVTVARDFRTAL